MTLHICESKKKMYTNKGYRADALIQINKADAKNTLAIINAIYFGTASEQVEKR